MYEVFQKLFNGLHQSVWLKNMWLQKRQHQQDVLPNYRPYTGIYFW